MNLYMHIMTKGKIQLNCSNYRHFCDKKIDLNDT